MQLCIDMFTRVQLYTLIQNDILKLMFQYRYIKYGPEQHPTFFICAVPNVGQPPVLDLYLIPERGGGVFHDGLRKAQ